MRSPTEVERGRQAWAEQLTNKKGWTADLHGYLDELPSNPPVVHVSDRAICQQAAAAFDQARGALELNTLVFSAGGYYLVSQPNEHFMVFDRRWKLLVYYAWQ